MRDIMGKEARWPYKAFPEGWNTYNHKVDYCGPYGRWYSRYIKPKIMGIDCNMCYWAHDERYVFGVDEGERRFADKVMYEDQKACINASTRQGSLKRYVAHVIGHRRYLAVKWFGRKAFKKAGSGFRP